MYTLILKYDDGFIRADDGNGRICGTGLVERKIGQGPNESEADRE